ncbi:hypothetical protein EVAR_33832_1 [Eumeta japonica]|uniref:Uncharacterized protein n=1 Tax=Eumeta variegata TaxID=151549 RepID=A0A4C1VAJ1_EUMVA|nr:hypothetical protein EVAR_33832_1 [Eumeta japonica]
MARLSLLIVISQLLILPSLGKDNEEQSPFADLTSAFLQNMANGGGEGLGALGSILGALMQNDGSKNNGGADVLSGIGSLLASQANKMDPSTLGTVISLVSQLAASANEDSTQRTKRDAHDNGVDLENIFNVVSGFLDSKNAGLYMPIIMNVISSFAGNQADKIAHDHKEHANFLPPYLERAHLYWDVFTNSELGKTIWKKSGLEKAMKAFKGPDGKISLELMLKNLENHSFRRHWIKAAAVYLTDTVVHMAKPEVYKRYLASAQYLINGYLDSQNLPKSTHFSVTKPEKSITALINHILKKYLQMNTDVSAYVKPAVDYIKQTLKMAQSTGQTLASRGDYHAIADRLTDTLNLEVIEPVLRVYRAYRHSLMNPQCQEHLMCLVNKHHDSDKQDLPGFKAGLTKLSSLVASAAISYQHGKGFWDLYNAIQNDHNCEAKYPADCAAFHEHEMKVTTEVYHSEL